MCGGNQAAVEKMLQFGRELQAMSVQLCREFGKNDHNKKALQVRESYARVHLCSIIRHQELNIACCACH